MWNLEFICECSQRTRPRYKYTVVEKTFQINMRAGQTSQAPTSEKINKICVISLTADAKQLWYVLKRLAGARFDIAVTILQSAFSNDQATGEGDSKEG